MHLSPVSPHGVVILDRGGEGDSLGIRRGRIAQPAVRVREIGIRAVANRYRGLVIVKVGRRRHAPVILVALLSQAVQRVIGIWKSKGYLTPSPPPRCPQLRVAVQVRSEIPYDLARRSNP
jgi:hypothetical protein